MNFVMDLFLFIHLTNCFVILVFKVKEERYQVEEKLAVLELQHRSLQDLIATLKDGRGAAKVMEWHSKLDAVRIEELKHKRLNSKLQQQV